VKKKLFQLECSQSGAPDGPPFEAENLEKAQEYVLLGMGYVVREVENDD